MRDCGWTEMVERPRYRETHGESKPVCPPAQVLRARALRRYCLIGYVLFMSSCGGQ